MVILLRLSDEVSSINANLDIICSFCNETTEKVGAGSTPPPGHPKSAYYLFTSHFPHIHTRSVLFHPVNGHSLTFNSENSGQFQALSSAFIDFYLKHSS